jgi:hypothetical protein
METENEEIIYLDDSSDESGDESNESDLDEEKEEIKIENLSKIQPEIVTLSDSDSENDSTNEEIFDENNVNTKVLDLQLLFHCKMSFFRPQNVIFLT